MNKSVILGLVVLTAFACKKDNDINPEGQATFDFSHPIENFMYPLGDTIHITGMISAEAEMHGYELNLINTSYDSEVLLHKHIHEDAAKYHVHDMWINNVTAHGNLELKVTALVDHEGTKESKTYYFMAHPM